MTITQDPSETSNRRGAARARGARVAWFVVFTVFATLYALTASRGIQWQDAGAHIVRIMKDELANPLGLALSHPLHFWLGRAALWLGFAEPAYAITLVSAMAGAVAVANVFGCVVTLTDRRAAGFVAGCSLGLANTFWQMSTLAECNALTAALLSAEVWTMVTYLHGRRIGFLYLAFLLNGLGIANHMQAALTSPLLLVILVHAVVRYRVRIRDVLGITGAWLIGMSPYVGFVVLMAVRSGDLSGTIGSALFGNAYTSAVLNVSPSWRQAAIVIGFVLLNFPNLTLPLFLRSFSRRSRRMIPVGCYRWLVAALGVHALFALRYHVVDQHTFFLPMYVVVAMLAGLGFAAVSNSRRRLVARFVGGLLLLTPIVYACAPSLAGRAGALRHIVHHKPYRDDYVYLFVPWTVAERSAERLGREAMELARDDGLVLIEDSMARPAVEYRRIHEHKPGVEILLRPRNGDIDLQRVDRALAHGRSVVLVPLDRNRPAILPLTGSWRRVGDLYVLDHD